MSRLRRRVAVLFALGVFAVVPAFAAAPRFVTIDVPGATASAALGINPSGDMVGAYVAGNVEHGFILRNGIITTVDYPGALWTECWGINPQGDVVGQYFLAANKTTHGFLLPAGSSDAIPIDAEQPSDLGAANTMPYKINPEGTITGCLHQSNANGGALIYTMHGFVMNAGGTTQDPLAGSMHTGNNASGAVTGHYYTSNTTLESYIIQDGVVTWFSVDGMGITRAWDINSSGDVVGFCRVNMSSRFHGFLYHDGTITLIDVPFEGVTGTRIYGINSEGDIVGNYFIGSVTHGFLLTKRGN